MQPWQNIIQLDAIKSEEVNFTDINLQLVKQLVAGVLIYRMFKLFCLVEISGGFQ